MTTTLAERGGQPRSRSIVSMPLRKPHRSIRSPANSSPAASSAARTRWRDAKTASDAAAGSRGPPPSTLVASQATVTRGIRADAARSRRRRSPASKAAAPISARPSRSRRRRSHSSGLSVASRRTRASPVPSSTRAGTISRCWPRKVSSAGAAARLSRARPAGERVSTVPDPWAAQPARSAASSARAAARRKRPPPSVTVPRARCTTTMSGSEGSGLARASPAPRAARRRAASGSRGTPATVPTLRLCPIAPSHAARRKPARTLG